MRANSNGLFYKFMLLLINMTSTVDIHVEMQQKKLATYILGEKVKGENINNINIIRRENINDINNINNINNINIIVIELINSSSLLLYNIWPIILI